MTKQSVNTRTRNSARTKRDILIHAKKHFARHAYESVSLRKIAAEVGIDHALIPRYFGSKPQLFESVLAEVNDTEMFVLGERSTVGQRIGNMLLSADEDSVDSALVIIRAVGSQHAARLVQEICYDQYTRPIADWLGGEAAELRAHLIGATIFGTVLSTLVDKKFGERSEARVQLISVISRMLQDLVDGKFAYLPSENARTPVTGAKKGGSVRTA